MERPRGFFTKRSEHYNNIHKEESNKKKSSENNLSVKESEKVVQEQSPSPKVENLDPNKVSQSKTPLKANERPLKCLETLAQKAGITFDEKYEMEKAQSPAQQMAQQQQQAQQHVQITPEQFQQLQQLQLQQAIANAASQPVNTIQVKQEYATNQQQQQTQGISAADLKTLQDHQMQMQIVQESPQSPLTSSQQNAIQQAVQSGQVPAEWQHGRLQVIQQPQYLPQMYSPQLVMSGNILHSGLGQQQQIQLIASGKPFQNQLSQQMLTAGGKSVLSAGGQASFSGYTLPTIPSSQSQTVLFSPVAFNSVINSPQGQTTSTQNILPTMQNQSTPTKSDGSKQIGPKQILQKVSQAGNTQQQQTVTGTIANQQQQNNQQCVQVSQTMPTAQLLSGQAMQFASPWQLQGMPFWTNGIQPQTLLTTNPILIRGTNPDGSPIYIQQSPQQATQQSVQQPHNQISLVGNIAQTTSQQKVRPSSDSLAPKTQQTQQRAPTILPQGAQIRPASSVSTQTAMNQNTALMAKAPKVRTKQTPVRPAAPNIKVSLNQQTGQPTMMQQVVTPGGVNKMVVMSNINGQYTPVLQQNTAQQINDKLKTQQQQQQQVILQQMANFQQQNAQQQQQQLQQQIAQIQLHQQQFLQQSQGTPIMQSGNIQQVVLQQHPQPLPTVTVTSGVSLQQQMPSQLTQQTIMTKAGPQQVIMQPQPTPSSSVATSMASTQIVTSMAGNVTADTSNSILGPLSSPQQPIAPPQNPLIAMTTLSASPMSSGLQKDKPETNTGDILKTGNVTLSPMKRQAEDTKHNEAKKQAVEEPKKSEDVTTVTTSTSMTSPNVSKTSSAPGTPTSGSKSNPISQTPLVVQNGDSETPKKTTGMNMPMLKNELPKAMVKPNVLTHVIEGFVIQESNEPFPVTRQRYNEKENDEPPKKKSAVEDSKANESPKTNGEVSGVTSSAPQPTDMVKCEQCGKQEMRSKLKKKRFCSLVCARARKSTSTDGSPSVSNGDEKSQISDRSLNDSNHNEKSKTEGSEGDLPPIEEHIMMKWSVAQVCDFIKNLPGCTDYAEDFKLQEIDGQALLLLKENHLVSAMGMKLGPALKIVNKIESMRVSKEGEPTETPPE